VTNLRLGSFLQNRRRPQAWVPCVAPQPEWLRIFKLNLPLAPPWAVEPFVGFVLASRASPPQLASLRKTAHLRKAGSAKNAFSSPFPLVLKPGRFRPADNQPARSEGQKFCSRKVASRRQTTFKVHANPSRSWLGNPFWAARASTSAETLLCPLRFQGPDTFPIRADDEASGPLKNFYIQSTVLSAYATNTSTRRQHFT
jgi:hypothetical protein